MSESQTRRLIVRASDTENLIRIMVEASTQELCRFMCSRRGVALRLPEVRLPGRLGFGRNAPASYRQVLNTHCAD
ncbi:MAG: hypothetical protein J6W39_04690 [Spirochaetales bacterium]|nr:hypothetical protein [Spirochaetales bacterium]